MTECSTRNRPRLRRFSVGYYLEQGFVVTVSARSAADAARIVRNRLDTECGAIAGSERVHYDDGITGTSEVQP